MANKTRAQLKLEWITGNTMTQSTSGGLDVAFDDVWDSHFNLGDDGLQEVYEKTGGTGGTLALTTTYGALSVSGDQDINLSSTDGGDSLSISIDQATDTITTSVTDGVDTTTVSTTATTFDATNSTGTATIEFDDTTVKGTTNLDLVSDSPVEVKNAVGAAQRIKGDTPVDTDDLATKDYIDTKNLESFPSGVGDGAYTVTVSGGGVTLTVAGAGTGNVTGPGSSTDTAVVRWNGATGTSIQNSGVLIDGTNNVTGVGTLDTTGTITTSTGDIVATAGNIEATAGSLTAGTTIDATGNITTSTGNVIATAGNLEATAGSVTAGTTVDATGNITTSTGDVIATAGNLEATAGNLTIGGDDIIGATQTVNVTEIRTHIDSTTNPHNTTIGNIGTGTRAELETAITDVTTFVVSGDAAGGDLGNTYPDPKVIALTDTGGTRYPLGSLGGPTGNKYLYVNGAGQIIGTTGVGGSDLQQGYDLSPGGGAAEIVTDDGATGRGAVTLRPDGDGTVHGGGLVPDTDNVLEIKDGTNTFTNFAVTGEGKVTGFSFNGVELTTAGVATKFLDEQGNYTIPGASTNLEGNLIYVDAVHGNDTSAIVENSALPFATIGAAAGVAGAGDVIFVRPGDYPEQDILLPVGVGLVGTGGWGQTTIGPPSGSATGVTGVGAAGTGWLVQLQQDSYINGFTFNVPIDSSNNGQAAIICNSSGGTNTNGIYNVNFYGDGVSRSYATSASSDNPAVNSSCIFREGGGKTIGGNLRIEGGGMENVFVVNQGVLALEGIHVPNSAGSITNVLFVQGPAISGKSNAGRAQMIGFNVGNPNVRYAIRLEGGTNTTPAPTGGEVVCLVYVPNIFNCENAVWAEGQYLDLNLLGGRIDNLNAAGAIVSGLKEYVGNAVVVPPASSPPISAPETAKFRITASHQPNYFYPPESSSESDFILNFMQEREQGVDPQINMFGAEKVAMGFVERGTGLSVGRGAPYTSGMVVLAAQGITTPATDDGTPISNVTEDAVSTSGSQFTFGWDGVSGVPSPSDELALYFGSLRQDWDGVSTATPKKFWGIELNINSAEAPLTAGTYVFEIWNGSNWVEIDAHAVSKDRGFSYANDFFWRNNSIEIIRFGLDEDTLWDTKSVNGIEAYWVRARIGSTGGTLATAPVFESVKLVESAQNISNNGVISSTGLAQFRKNISLNGAIWSGAGSGGTGGLVERSAPTFPDIGATGAYEHKIKDSVFDSGGDAFNIQFPIPTGACTAFPLNVYLVYEVSDPTTPWTLETRALPMSVSGNLVADTAGSIPPIERPVAETKLFTTVDVITNSGIVTESAVNMLHKILVATIPIADCYQEDVIAFQVEGDVAGSGDLAVWSLIAEGVSYQDGKEIS